jgi:hypothetical protein
MTLLYKFLSLSKIRLSATCLAVTVFFLLLFLIPSSLYTAQDPNSAPCLKFGGGFNK